MKLNSIGVLFVADKTVHLFLDLYIPIFYL